MSTLSPNMNLVLPTIGIDSGLTWEQSVNINSGILDGHNHSIGSGVQINPSGMNINADLPFNGFNAITLRSARFDSQGSPISLAADLDCIYVSGVDLYYNDGNGNQVRLTSGGTVNATSSGISSGTNTASFSSSTLVVDSASNTPANIQVASVLIGNTGVSGSKFITLSPTGTLPANYSLNLPALPAQTNVMTLDTSGNMSSITYDQVGSNMTSVGANAIGVSMTSTGANATAESVTRSSGSSVGILGIAISSSCGTFSITNQSNIAITNFSVTLVTSGRPIMVMIIPDGNTTTPGIMTQSSTGNVDSSTIKVLNNSSVVFTTGLFVGTSSGVQSSATPLTFLDIQPAGTYIYTVTATTGNGFSCINMKLLAYEI